MRIVRLLTLCATALLVALLATVAIASLIRRPPVQPAPIGTVPPVARDEVADSCAQRRQALLSAAALPGDPALEAVRPELVARAKAEPVLFLESPAASNASKSIEAHRRKLFQDGVPWQAFSDVFSDLKRYPSRLRQVILTDGYLYARKPDLAALLASGIGLNQLYSEPEVIVTRGTVRRKAIRKRDDYVWADGEDAGQPARLWLFDRIRVNGEVLGPDKHVTIGDLPSRIGASHIEIERMTEDAVLAYAIYGEQRIPAVLVVRGGQLELECEVIPAQARAEVQAARTLAQRRARVIERLRTAIAEQIHEGLPFDEPKTEEGQQDGKLRQQWRTAYLQGQSRFEFNGDEYPVFGQGGIPRIPQVCVDFVTDTWERMADTRWAKRDEQRERRVGRLDFDALGIENRRSVENLIDFSVAHPEWFEILLIPESERVPLSNRAEFFRRLYELRQEFQPGDVVAILGPRDDEKLHYHSFFIVASDPLTSMPTLVAANAGRPRIRTWEGEMQNAPRRSIMARIRPRLEWMEAVAGLNGNGASEMAKL